MSDSQIEYARKNYALPNLTFAVGDAATFTVDRQFDRLTSFNALHWVHDLEAAAAAIAECLRPGGTILLRVVAAGPRTSLEQVIAQTSLSPRWSAQFESFVQPFEHRDGSRVEGAAQRGRPAH